MNEGLQPGSASVSPSRHCSFTCSWSSTTRTGLTHSSSSAFCPVHSAESCGLASILSNDAGLSSGYMIAHVAAAALLNDVKSWRIRASVDSAPTSGGKEDHVSMGMTAALKLRQIVRNTEEIVAIEMLCAAEGLDYRKPLKPGMEGREGTFRATHHRSQARNRSFTVSRYWSVCDFTARRQIRDLPSQR